MDRLIDITHMSDAALDVFLRAKGGEDGIPCDHLTVTERRQVADAMGWTGPSVALWVRGGPADREPPCADTRDYEGMILDQADKRYGDYL